MKDKKSLAEQLYYLEDKMKYQKLPLNSNKTKVVGLTKSYFSGLYILMFVVLLLSGVFFVSNLDSFSLDEIVTGATVSESDEPQQLYFENDANVTEDIDITDNLTVIEEMDE